MGNKYEIDLGLKSIKLYDSRWYELATGEKFPSVTTILNAKAKGSAIEKWGRGLGLNYESVMNGLMDSGSKIHNACEQLLKGEPLSFVNEMGEENYSFDEWKKILAFKDFVILYDVKPIYLEQTIYSKEHGYAGTLDLVCNMKQDPKKDLRQIAIIDYKSGKNCNTGYLMQIASYYKAARQLDVLEIKPISAYVLNVGMDTKKGWKLTQCEDIEYMFECFLAVKKIWELDNPNFNMMQKTYPIEISLSEHLSKEVA